MPAFCHVDGRVRGCAGRSPRFETRARGTPAVEWDATGFEAGGVDRVRDDPVALEAVSQRTRVDAVRAASERSMRSSRTRGARVSLIAPMSTSLALTEHHGSWRMRPHPLAPGSFEATMKYLTTLEVAHELNVSKQTLLNWLYAGKIPEPPRNRKGYRLWSPSRVSLVRKLIGDGRLHKRTVVHKEASNRPEIVTEFAREVNQFLRDGKIDAEAFLRELARLNPGVGQRMRPRKNSGGRGFRDA
jgi:hypothetical protein